MAAVPSAGLIANAAIIVAAADATAKPLKFLTTPPFSSEPGAPHYPAVRQNSRGSRRGARLAIAVLAWCAHSLVAGARFGRPARTTSATSFFGASNVTVDGLDLEGGDASTNLGDGVFSSQHSASASTHDVIEHCTIENWARGIQTGYADSDWTIAENTIDTIALDGVYFARSKDRGGVGPQNDVVTGNWIANTGIFPHAGGNTSPVHGIYDNSINSEIANNTISQFQSDGVSVRFRGSRVTDNAISGGQIGIAWFQEDPVATTSNWMAM
jgi:Periplasmic copper-binding protein (NosD)